MLRRLLPTLIVAGISTLVVFTLLLSGSWRRIPQSVGLGEVVGPTEEEKANAIPDSRPARPSMGQGAFREPQVDSASPYPVGELKPPGSNYTKAVVVPRMKAEKASWIEDELPDLLENGLVTPYVYVMDDMFAKLHPPINKGHEVMAYLTYIIQFYDDLKDVNIFMHFHRTAWHNNALLIESPQMVRHLSPERVTRDGYMNLRCHWDPGCPAWVHPGATVRDPEKQEEWIIAESWAELFPLDPIPTILAQPCCAQFAVSRDRIRATPKQRYVSMRDWVMQTELSDYVSGRVFEYIWQYIFTAAPIHCPSASACYCDGYGFCFGDPDAFNYWFDRNLALEEYKAELLDWNQAAEGIEKAIEQSKDGRLGGEEKLRVPEAGRNKWLVQQIDQGWAELMEMKKNAVERGKDPRNRALESGREWTEGDGF